MQNLNDNTIIEVMDNLDHASATVYRTLDGYSADAKAAGSKRIMVHVTHDVSVMLTTFANPEVRSRGGYEFYVFQISRHIFLSAIVKASTNLSHAIMDAV